MSDIQKKTYIALGGPQGTGKTTYALDLTRKLKVAGYSANLWTDIPRECPLPINEKGSIHTQLWISARMVSRTVELLHIYDYVVSDRSPLDCCIYQLIESGRWDDKCQLLMDMSATLLLSTKSTVLWVKKGWTPTEFEKGRTTDRAFNKAAPDAAIEVRMRMRALESSGLSVVDIDLTESPPDLDLSGSFCIG